MDCQVVERSLCSGGYQRRLHAGGDIYLVLKRCPGGLNGVPKRCVCVLISRTCDYYLICYRVKVTLCGKRYDRVKNFDKNEFILDYLDDKNSI